MKHFRRFASQLALAMLIPLAAAPAWAHGSSKGALQVQHAYAVSGQASGAGTWVYFRAIRNDGHQTDRLLSASTPVASGVELQRIVQPGGQESAVPVAAIELPAATNMPMRHNLGVYRLMLLGLRQPLKDGDRFDLTLHFALAGPLTTQVWVQGAARLRGNDPPMR